MSDYVIFYDIFKKGKKEHIGYYETSDWDGLVFSRDIKYAQKIRKNSHEYDLLKSKGLKEIDVNDCKDRSE